MYVHTYLYIYTVYIKKLYALLISK